MDLSRATSVSAEIDPPLVIQVIKFLSSQTKSLRFKPFWKKQVSAKVFLPKLIMRELNKEDAMDRCKWRKVIKEAR